ncbi:MAG: Gldg family protein [Immundisolibacterales bacterium]|nr:Gldg family protein [Immundisolibacterales bacterium]
MGGRTYTIGGIVLAVAVFLALNMFANQALTRFRIDLTEQRLFTLSEGTRNILRALDEPVTLRFYVSRNLASRLPSVSGYVARVRDLLTEYEHAAEGRIVLTVIAPEPFSDEEDRAVGFGLNGIPLLDGESTFYFGLVGTNSLDDQEVIPRFSPEREEFLEYDVTKMIHTLGQAELPVVGLVSTLPLDGQSRQAMMTGRPPEPWLILERIEELFEVRHLSPAELERVDEDVDVLMVVHPTGFSDRTRYAIDQFVVGGGHALVFVDPNAEADMNPTVPGLPPVPGKSEFEDLLGAWGLALDTALTVGDMQLGADVQAQVGDRVANVRYPVWINVPAPLLNREDVVTAQLGNLTFATPGSLAPAPDGGLEVTSLAATTAAGAGLVDTNLVGPMANIEQLVREFRPDGAAHRLAVRIGGNASSAFPEGPPAAGAEDAGASEGSVVQGAPDEDAAESSRPEHVGEGEINIIVVGDTDMLQDRFWVREQNLFGHRLPVPISANGSFVINALDNLAGSGDLIGIRSRGRFLRPFTVVNELRQEAELRFREKERELIQRLEETEARLSELRSGEGAESVLTTEQRDALTEFTNEQLRIRKELRDVRHSLRKDIEALETWLKFVNIALVPIVIGVGGLLAGLHRMRRRRAAARPLAA